MQDTQTTSWPDRNLSPALLLFNALCLLVMNLLTSGLGDKLVLFSCLQLLNRLRRRRINFLFQGIFLLTLVLLNLYPPLGQVLFRVFTLPVTTGSLSLGLSRGLGLLNYVLLAKYGVSPGLRFPGRGGRLLARTLFFLERMQAHKIHWRKKGLYAAIDELLQTLWKEREIPLPTHSRKSTLAGLLFLLGNILIIIILLYYI